MGGLCREGHDFLRLCKKRNKGATLHLLDVLVTQHAKWTARRIRRALFGQSLVDFSGPSWSSIKLRADVPEPKLVNRRKKKISETRMMREFSQADDAGNASDDDSSVSFSTTTANCVEESATVITQRIEFFELSPRKDREESIF